MVGEMMRLQPRTVSRTVLVSVGLLIALTTSALACSLPPSVAKIIKSNQRMHSNWCGFLIAGADLGNRYFAVGQNAVEGTYKGISRDIGIEFLRRATNEGFEYGLREYLKHKLDPKKSTAKDFDEAFAQLRKWAAEGSGDAALEAAEIHTPIAVPPITRRERRDVTTHMTWLRIANALGDGKQLPGMIPIVKNMTRAMLPVIERSRYAKPAQVAESKKRARQWLQKHRPASLKACTYCK